MPAPATTRFFAIGYLALFGALSALVAAHTVHIPILGLGVLCLPASALWFWQERQARKQDQHMAAAWRELEERSRALADAFAIGLFLTDLQGQVVQTNSALPQMMGLDDSSLRSRRVQEYTLHIDI